jgi:hypothetical protein
LLEMRRERETGAGSPSAVVAIPTAASAAPEVAEPAPAEAKQVAETPPAEPAQSAPTKAPAQAPARKPWTFGLAAAYAHFGTEVPGAMGPRLTVSHVLIQRLHLTAAVDLKAGLGSSEGFGVLDVSAVLGATFDVFPFLSATLAPLLVVTTFQPPPGTTGPTSPIVAGGFVASARGRIPLEPIRPFVELGVLAATPARQVTLSNEPVLTVPEWQALVAVGVELPL